MRFFLPLLAPVFCLLTPAFPDPAFRPHTIATGLKGGYQVVAADLTRNGRPDLIALASGLTELLWFENPGWQRHVLAANRSALINLDAWDVDGDGVPEIVLAEGFSSTPARSAGIVSVLKHNGDPRQPWTATEIDRLPTSHRIRWAGIDGDGRKVAVNAPLAGAAAEPPEFRAPVPLVLYRPGAWKRELISDELDGILHGIAITDWDGDGREDILTAGFRGIHLFQRTAEGWRRTELAPGSPRPWPRSGSSDVAVGRLGARRFLAAIEPWHGNELAVYLEEKGAWRRSVIDDALVDGHALLTADLDRDGRDEIVAGYRGKGRSVYIYAAEDAAGSRWRRRPLDEGGMGAASCVAADLNASGRLDLACIDSNTLKWYEN